MRFDLSVNGATAQVEAEAGTPLLWVLRDGLGLTGTKYGCGIGLCGACMVHVDGRAVRSCLVTVDEVATGSVTTIEGLADGVGRALCDAWIEESVVQCGYCQAGQIMAAAALLAERPDPTGDEIATTMSDILCRCGTYGRIRAAITRVAGQAGS